jgi:MFS transporter, AAHS family, 4-hydroxybenzoate transporter
MKEIASLDLNELVDGQRMRPASVIFLITAMLVLISDGFDLSAMGYVAPELIKLWHVAPGQFVGVFSAGIIGLLFGAPLLSLVGDRYGRRKAILVGLTFFGALTLMTVAATSLRQFMVLRFITGLGLGGVIPNVTALVAELAPKRLRGRWVVFVNLGVAAGISLPGLVAAGFVPRFGWQVLLIVGGALPLSVALLAFFLLPESIKYLAQRSDRDVDMRKLARWLRPDLAIPSDTVISSAKSSDIRRGSPKGLFQDGLAAMTPLLWVVVAANQMATFFSLTWLPTLLQSTGSSTSQAGIGGALFSIGGLVGGLGLLFVIDRLGVIPLVVLFVLGTPLVAAIGIVGLSPSEHLFIIAAAGFCVTGINFGVSAVLGLVYPTPIRSTGTGWAQAAGRLGAIAAPIAGGALLKLNLPMEQLPLAPALVLGIGALACITLAVLCVRRFQSLRLDEYRKSNTSVIVE